MALYYIAIFHNINLGNVDYDLNFEYGDGTDAYSGCGAVMMGEMWYFGGSESTTQQVCRHFCQNKTISFRLVKLKIVRWYEKEIYLLNLLLGRATHFWLQLHEFYFVFIGMTRELVTGRSQRINFFGIKCFLASMVIIIS